MCVTSHRDHDAPRPFRKPNTPFGLAPNPSRASSRPLVGKLPRGCGLARLASWACRHRDVGLPVHLNAPSAFPSRFAHYTPCPLFHRPSLASKGDSSRA